MTDTFYPINKMTVLAHVIFRLIECKLPSDQTTMPGITHRARPCALRRCLHIVTSVGLNVLENVMLKTRHCDDVSEDVEPRALPSRDEALRHRQRRTCPQGEASEDAQGSESGGHHA